MLRYSLPPGYIRRRQPAQRSKWEAWQEIIEQIQEQDQARSNNQHHSGPLSGYERSTDYGRLHHCEGPCAPPKAGSEGDAHTNFGEARRIRPFNSGDAD